MRFRATERAWPPAWGSSPPDSVACALRLPRRPLRATSRGGPAREDARSSRGCSWPPLGSRAASRDATRMAERGRRADAGGADASVGVGPTVRIAAFNVHRFFDTVCDSAACGGSNYEELPSPEEFSARASQLAAAIASLNAGVVLVEEVESQASLDALRTRLPGLPWAVLGETGCPRLRGRGRALRLAHHPGARAPRAGAAASGWLRHHLLARAARGPSGRGGLRGRGLRRPLPFQVE